MNTRLRYRAAAALAAHAARRLGWLLVMALAQPAFTLPAAAQPAVGQPAVGPPASARAAMTGPRREAGVSPPSALCVFCLDYWQLLKGDVREVMTSPARWDGAEWRSVGTKALLVAGAMALIDDGAERYVDEHKSSTTDRIAADFQPFGRQYAAYVLGGFLLAGQLADRPKAKAVAVDGLTSTIIAAGLIVPGLKAITGRSRPRTGLGAHDFHPFNGGYSFPSGHTAAAFSVAASIAQHYDALWIKGLAYGAASLVDYARMERDAHFFSDVTAGALIGIGVARSVHGLDQGRRASFAVHSSGGERSGGRGDIELSVAFALR